VIYGGSMSTIYLMNGNELTRLKTDKVPIGYALNEQPKVFSNYQFNVHTDTIVYLFSDGIVDQFGGDGGKKLMAKNFQKQLMLNSGLSLMNQHQQIEKFFNAWKGNYEQTDDILLIGIQFS